MNGNTGPVKSRLSGWYLLLLLPVLAIGWVSSYNSIEPRLFGFPFFWWYQMLWVVLSVVITAVIYLVTR